MSYPNKENNVVGLFFNEPTKHWHFKDIVKNAKMSEQRANYWLKQMVKEGLIKHIKPKGKMPYFIAQYENPYYRNKKKLYALNLMFETGLLNRLQSLENAKAVVIFGSFSRSDWNSNSDVDVFVYGDPEGLKFGTLWQGRDVEVHTCRTKEEIKEIKSGLINNVVKGYFIKGNVHDLVDVSV
ncbi:nucleotidyltransferase domain-containing protein [Candidatus Woesearchaeota archaeon]|nr:nucleotidyltransferase domain-containing protein [Candidatus Woesearchaeota archaeon]